MCKRIVANLIETAKLQGKPVDEFDEWNVLVYKLRYVLSPPSDNSKEDIPF